MKIYVASSWRNEHQQSVVKTLREAGHKVYDFKNPSPTDRGFAWSDIDPDWQQWSTNEFIASLSHPIAEKGFKNDFNAMKRADVCVMVLPCGRSASLELGWMAGAGKPTIILHPPGVVSESDLMYKLANAVYIDINDVLLFLQILQQTKTRFSRMPIGYDYAPELGIYDQDFPQE